MQSEFPNFTAKALALALDIHKNQKYSEKPFIYHPTMVSLWINTACIVGGCSPTVIDVCVAAGLLHDSIEDTSANYNDIREATCAMVADIVYDVTDELGKNRIQRKLRTVSKIKENPLARLVKFADRLVNFNESLEAFYIHGPAAKPRLKMYLDEHEEFIANFSFVGKALSGNYVAVAKAINYLEGQLTGVCEAAKVAYYEKK